MENVKISRDFISKVYDGGYNESPKFIKEMDSYLATQNKKAKDYYFYYEDLIGGKMPHYVGNTESIKDFSSKLKSFIDSTLLYKGNKSFSCECGKKYLIIFYILRCR